MELKEGGATIPVTNENKKEFVQLSANYRLYSSIKEQIESLVAGFYEIIPKDLVSIVSGFLLCPRPCELTTSFSSTSKSLSCSSPARPTSTSMSGGPRRSTTGTRARILSSSGSGVRSSRSTAKSVRRCSALPRVLLGYHSAASSSSRVCRVLSASQYTRRTATQTVFRKLTLVSLVA